MEKHFFNTAGEDAQTEIEFETKAKHQEHKILIWLQKHQVREFTAYYILNNVFGSSVPITSVRRALTKMKDQGYIEDSGTKVNGPKGRKTIQWKLVSLAPTENNKKTLRQRLNSIDDDKIEEIWQNTYCQATCDEFHAGAIAIIKYLKNDE